MAWIYKNKIQCIALLGSCLLSFSACTSIKPYQRAYLEDRDMSFQQNAPERFEQSVHTYREGAAGGDTGKSSGGCGCN